MYQILSVNQIILYTFYRIIDHKTFVENRIYKFIKKEIQKIFNRFIPEEIVLIIKDEVEQKINRAEDYAIYNTYLCNREWWKKFQNFHPRNALHFLLGMPRLASE